MGIAQLAGKSGPSRARLASPSRSLLWVMGVTGVANAGAAVVGVGVGQPDSGDTGHSLHSEWGARVTSCS